MVEIDNSKVGPGKLLADARKKLGLSKPDIASQLNLSVSIIEQLESDKYKDDIPDAFLRGYIRTYARVVDLDEEEIVSLYSDLTGSVSVTYNYVPSSDVPPAKIQVSSHQLWFKMLSVIVFLVILILGWLAFRDGNDSKSISAEQNTTNNPQPYNSQSVNDTPSIQIDSTSNEPQATEALAALPRGFVDAPSLTNAELEFYFINDCWVQVVDSNNEVLAVGLKTAGRRFTVSGVPPISIVLGKPRAISLQYNNQAVDLSIYPASQSARFTLGDGIAAKNTLADRLPD